MQDLTLGKYVVNWVREEYFQNSKMSEMAKMATISNYELSSVKVCQSSLFAEAKIPAFAVARVPFGVVFKLKNRSSHVLEFNMNMESSEAFMLSGNKQLHFKISPFATYELHYVFYPLLAGDSVPLPRPKLSSARPAMPHDDVSATLERLLPSSILGEVLSLEKLIKFSKCRKKDTRERMFQFLKLHFIFQFCRDQEENIRLQLKRR